MMTQKKRGFGVVEVIIILAVIGLAAVLVWFFVTKNTDDTADQPDDQTAQVEELTPENVTEKIKNHFAESYTLLDVEKNNNPKKGQLSVSSEVASPAYKVDGYDYYVTYNGGSSLYIATPASADGSDLPSEADKDIRREVSHIYHEVGLDSTENRSDAGGSTTNVYTGKGLICTIESPDAAIGGSTTICGKLSAYPAVARQLKPISDAIEYDGDTTVFANANIKPSKSGEYQIASVAVGSTNSVGGAVAILSKHGVNNWKLFRYTQNTLACNAYDTAALRNAFEGEPCYDTETEKEQTVSRDEEK